VTATTTASQVAATTKKGTDMTKVRTTFTPDTVLDVPADEADSLQQQGLLHSREHESGTPVPKGLEPWKGAPEESVVVSPDLAPAEVTTAPELTTKKKGA